MTVVIDGTNGISGVDGTASNPVYEGTDTDTGIFFPSANRIGFSTSGTQRGEFDASGNFQFNSGYGSVATAYGCRAWVNFDGTANTNLSGTYSQSGTTVTVTATAHGLLAGNVVYSDITTGTAVDGTYTVATVVNANSFTYTAGTSLTTSGNITLLRNTIRASGNVSSVADNAAGTYTVNLANAMPDANYSVVLGMNSATDGSFIKLGKSTGIGVPTTLAFEIRTTSFSAVPTDYPGVFVAVFR